MVEFFEKHGDAGALSALKKLEEECFQKETGRESSKMTRATARAQLRAVFAKTGVHRQSELVALCARLLSPPDLDAGDLKEHPQ